MFDSLVPMPVALYQTSDRVQVAHQDGLVQLLVDMSFPSGVVPAGSMERVQKHPVDHYVGRIWVIASHPAEHRGPVATELCYQVKTVEVLGSYL